jgi:hypothetical protein
LIIFQLLPGGLRRFRMVTTQRDVEECVYAIAKEQKQPTNDSGTGHASVALRSSLFFRHVAHDGQLEHFVLVGLKNQQNP